jgi:uncharacterized protein (DUF2342 family)
VKLRGQSAALWMACTAIACGKAGTPAAGKPVVAVPASVRRFTPPADGLLTDAELDHYAAVRRAARGRTEADAARALGVDPDEHAWVRARVVEALAALDERRVRAASAETYARTLAQLHETRKSVRDPATAKSIDEQIAGLEKERAAWKKPAPLPPPAAANARRVEKRRAEIEASLP